jgi:hypothetical protein
MCCNDIRPEVAVKTHYPFFPFPLSQVTGKTQSSDFTLVA